jgi:hypothetical protein
MGNWPSNCIKATYFLIKSNLAISLYSAVHSWINSIKFYVVLHSENSRKLRICMWTNKIHIFPQCLITAAFVVLVCSVILILERGDATKHASYTKEFRAVFLNIILSALNRI